MKDSRPYVIGMDFGSDSVRALLADAENGEIVDSEVVEYPRWKEEQYCDVSKSQFRQHPKDYLESLATVLSQLTRRNPSQSKQVRALAVDTTGSTPCFTNSKAVPLSLQEDFSEDPDAMFILWKDHTAQAESDEINQLMRNQPINYARQMGGYNSPEGFWPKVLHILRTNEHIRQKAYSVIELCDYIPAVLTGCTSIDKLRTGRCIAGVKMMWAEDWGGFPPEDFFYQLDPALVPILHHLPKEKYSCEHAVGILTEEWAARVGLPSGIPVGIGNVDSHSGSVGGGITYGTVVMSFGTSAAYMTVMPKAALHGRYIDGVFGQVDDSVLPGLVGFECGLSAFGDVFAWFKRLLSWPVEHIVSHTSLLTSEQKISLVNEVEESILPELTKAVEKLRVTEGFPLATDWFNGRRSPAPNNNLTASVTGLSLSVSASEIYYSLAEATALATKNVIDHLRKNGIYIRRLVAVGGIARKSPFVVQLIADALGLPLEVSGCKEAAATGSVIHAAVVAGLYPSVTEAQKALCAPSIQTYQPNTERTGFLLRRHARYQSLGVFTETQQKKLSLHIIKSSNMRTIEEPARRIPVRAEVDVLVVGGGPSGIMAAEAAAGKGLKVMLLESRGYLGGNMTIGLPILGFLNRQGKQIIKGLPQDFINRLKARGGASEHKPCKNHMSLTIINSEMVKDIALEIMQEKGVEVLMYVFVADVLREGRRVKGVIIESKAGREAILAKTIIDCTGDGDVAARAGVTMHKGNAEGGMQPPTLMYNMRGVEVQKLRDAIQNPEMYDMDVMPPEQFREGMFITVGLRNQIKEAEADGIKLPVARTILITGLNPDEIWVNMTRVSGVDSTKPESYTYGEIMARKQIKQVNTYLKKYVPGFAHAWMDKVAPFLGIRESRVMVGRYVLTAEDILACRRFPDAIAVGGYPVDIHHAKGTDCTMHFCPEDYDIPYRCLLPKDIDNLLVAGRCSSMNHEAMASTRVMSTCMALGEAAGRAARMAMQEGVEPADVDVTALRQELKETGAYLG